jgi:hypothetical protein
MKRRQQIAKLMYTPKWGQGDVVFLDAYEGMTRDDKLETLAYWINELLEARNALIPNPQSWHHFLKEKANERTSTTKEDQGWQQLVQR